MRLSEHFTFEELCKSDVAARLSIDNTPDLNTEAGGRIFAALTALCESVLEPVRTQFATPFRPSSGYRCLELNRVIGSKDSSQHIRGEAADFEVPGVANADLAVWIRDNLEFDQLILECYSPGQPASGWVHCSYVAVAGDNRQQAFTINRSGTTAGLIA